MPGIELEFQFLEYDIEYPHLYISAVSSADCSVNYILLLVELFNLFICCYIAHFASENAEKVFKIPII